MIEEKILSSLEWETFLDGLVAEEEISPAARNRIRSLATKMYNDGIRQVRFSHNPVSVIPKLKESMDAWDYWPSTDDIMSHLAAAQQESAVFYVFASLSLNLGTRIGETLALDIGDLNLHHRRLPIEKIYEELSGDICQRTKGHKKRWLGINDALFEILNQFKRTCSYNRSAAPVIHDGLGTRMTGHALRVIHERVCENAGLKKNSNSRFKTHIR